jgi:hypothetical protein
VRYFNRRGQLKQVLSLRRSRLAQLMVDRRPTGHIRRSVKSVDLRRSQKKA